MDENFLVIKSNYFIMNSSYDLSLEEQKLILTLASMVHPNDEDFKPYRFKISDFMELLGVSNQNKYTKVPIITRDLMKKVFEIKENNKLIQVAWLSSVIYEKGSGYVELEFSPKLKPYMLKLNNLFTKYKLTNILTMRSKYSPRIYEILKCNEFKKQGFIDLQITDLRKLLKVKDIYPRYFDFKKKIIMQSQRELNEKTDIKFTFEEIKTGRKVTSIRFFIDQKHEKKNHEQIENKDIIDTLENKEDLKFVYMLLSDKLSKVDCNKLYIAAKYDLKKIKRAYELSLKQRNIKNLFPWLKDCIEKDYSIPVAVTRLEENIDTFNDFPQRRYNFEELEAQLLCRK